MPQPPRTFCSLKDLDTKAVSFSLGVDRGGRPTICVTGATAFVTCAGVTFWPRVSESNYGSAFGPDDVLKSKFQLDITNAPFWNGEENKDFQLLQQKLDELDDALLTFVHANQQRILGRRQLSRDEVKMLQVASVREKFDKSTGSPLGLSFQMSTPAYGWDGRGGRVQRSIPICDAAGQVVQDGVVRAGDVVAATAYLSTCYSGVAGDKFGLHWAFSDCQVLLQQSASVENKTQVTEFVTQACSQYSFARPYKPEKQFELPTSTEQFPEPLESEV